MGNSLQRIALFELLPNQIDISPAALDPDGFGGYSLLRPMHRLLSVTPGHQYDTTAVSPCACRLTMPRCSVTQPHAPPETRRHVRACCAPSLSSEDIGQAVHWT